MQHERDVGVLLAGAEVAVAPVGEARDRVRKEARPDQVAHSDDARGVVEAAAERALWYEVVALDQKVERLAGGGRERGVTHCARGRLRPFRGGAGRVFVGGGGRTLVAEEARASLGFNLLMKT